MKNKTFETLNSTARRFEAILEIDDELQEWQKKAIRKMLFIIAGILAEIYETPKSSNP